MSDIGVVGVLGIVGMLVLVMVLVSMYSILFCYCGSVLHTYNLQTWS